MFRPLQSTQTIPHPHPYPSSNEQIGKSGQPSKSSSESASTPSPESNTEKSTQTTPLWVYALAGGFGGLIGDTSMHSLDTVKTRQQGASHIAKYNTTLLAYRNIFREEGFRRGLYGGYSAAMLGSLPSSAVFFLTYEYIKRYAINDLGVPETPAFLCAGFLGDLISSVFYVPSEVLKTRLQLQGRYNNPYFESGYNYKNLTDAVQTIIRKEGPGTLFYGFRATLTRDLPYSALQFAFYEKFRQLAFKLTSPESNTKVGMNEIDGKSLPLYAELLTGAAAGGLAGVITTPLDVVKTRMQTQNGTSANLLTSSSVISSLRTIYAKEGLNGLFSGVAPRLVWTSIQSSVVLVLYQVFIQALSGGDVLEG